MNELSSKQLRQAARIKDQITSLQNQLSRLFGGATAGRGRPAKTVTPRKRRKMSAAGRAKISAAATARWAKIRADKKKG